MKKFTRFTEEELNHRIAVNLSNIEIFENLRKDLRLKISFDDGSNNYEEKVKRYTKRLAGERRKLRDNKKRLSLLHKQSHPTSENHLISDSAVKYSLSAKPMDFKKVKIDSSSKSANFIRNFYHEDIIIYESVFILLLDRSNHTIGYAKISQGGVSSTIVDVKIIMKYAVDSLASGVILAHNHPSGTLYPSEPDLRITSKVKEALKYMDVVLLDHIILTKDSHYSFADNNQI